MISNARSPLTLALAAIEAAALTPVHPPIELDFRREDDRVHVRVVDPGTQFAPPAQPSKGDSSGGWGLFLVDRIAERWGVCPAPAGTCVWFEVPAGAGP